MVGPDLHFTSPLIDEEGYDSLAAVEADIRKWEREGYRWIKSHAITTEDFFDLRGVWIPEADLEARLEELASRWAE